MKIRTKLPLFTSVTVLFSIFAITFYAISDFRQKTMQSIESYRIEQTEFIKNQLKDNVNNAYKMIAEAHGMSITAQNDIENNSINTGKTLMMMNYLQLTVNNIASIRYAEAGYIWINEIEPPYRVVMHPIHPEFNGQVKDFTIKDTHQNVYEAFADVIHENDGAGFLEYDFYKPGSNEKIPKLSYLRLYEPKGWVIGTGVYIDHIEKMVARKTEELNTQTNKIVFFILIYGLALTALASIGLYYLGKTITDSIYKVRQLLFDMSKGKLVEKRKDVKKDEIGDMTNSLNSLIDGVNSYSDFALNIGKGNLSSDFTPLSEEDNLGNSLLKMRESLKNARDEEDVRQSENEIRNWANEGYTMFSDLMRKRTDNMTEMSYNIINTLVNYIGATQGGLFVYNDDDKENIIIELLASTAYSRRKFSEKRIKLGDGLVGMCAIERQKIYMTNVPDNYIEIRSGLGTANPESILIVPLMMETNLIGIIELAAFKKFKDYEIEFIEKISENIAASLYAAKINSKTSSLLAKFKLIEDEKDKLAEEIKNRDAIIRKMKKEIREKEASKSILSV